MITCPKCGIEIEEKTAVCECGAILFGEVTNVSGWETETVFRAVKTAKRRFLPFIAAAAVLVAMLFVLALPQISERLAATEQTSVEQTDAPQNPTKSDLVPTDDLIQPEAAVNTDNQSGAFEFTGSGKSVRLASKLKAARRMTITMASGESEASIADAKASKAVDPADCKLDIPAALKRPEPQTAIAEVKPQPKSANSGYILGPRGGCFIVTASGGKKYVDRGLCASSVGAARQ